MNRLFAVAAFSLLSPMLFAADVSERVLGELEASAKELESVKKDISAEREKLQNRLDEVLADINDAKAEGEAVSADRSGLLALSEKSKFYDSCASEVLNEASALAEQLSLKPIPPRGSALMAEAYEAASVALPEAFNEVFDPLQKKPAKAEDIDGNPVDGQSFRVGAFRYFIGDGRAGFLSKDDVLYGEQYAEKIINFATGASDEIPADTDGSLYETEKTRHTIGEEISLGGVWMYPILGFGFAALAVCIVKCIAFMRTRRAPKKILSLIFSNLEAGDEKGATAAAENAGYPYAGLLTELVKSRKLPAAMLEEISYESMLLAGEKLFSGLSVLSVTAAVSPLFGLLGTVTGIIKTFGDLSFHGAGEAQFISAGISEALITTEYGLVVAIPAFIAHAILSRRAKSVLADMEKLASGFVSSNKRNV